MAGQLIGRRLVGGSNIFKEKLSDNIIGLTYGDAKALGKLEDAEQYVSTKSYKNVLEWMDDEERDFFFVGKKGSEYVYRRVELNALTMPGILDFIREKIPKKQIRPTREQIRSMIDFDVDHLKRDAVIEHLLGKVDESMGAR